MKFIDKTLATLKSLVKITLQSKPLKHRPAQGGEIVVLGNGPSLKDTIAYSLDKLKTTECMAVNFAAIDPVFFEIKPKYYVLADPHFFTPTEDSNDNRYKLRKALKSVEWAMTLFVPAKTEKKAKDIYSNNNITIAPFNAVGVEGFDGFCNWAYSSGLGMPRPRNVLIPAIMIAINEGFKRINVVGADHSWMKTLYVTEENEVVSVQPHFYADSNNEEARIRHEYRGYRLHQIVESFAVAFRSYHNIERYAAKRGVDIINCTPGSFIDAFKRGSF